MRKLMLGAAVAACLAAGGCATTGPSNTEIVSDVQSLTTTACSFVPTAATVIALIGSSPALATAAAVANAICGAVRPKSAALRRGAAAPPTVNGVVIHGRFVR